MSNDYAPVAFVDPRLWPDFISGRNWMTGITANPQDKEATPLYSKATVDALQARVTDLLLAEEGAKEAFGVIVQQKRDLEKEISSLRETIQEQQRMIWRSASGL